MQHATQVVPELSRRLEDLHNELAYIDAFPERFDSQEARLVRRVAVIQMIAEVSHMLTGGRWAMPIELCEENAA